MSIERPKVSVVIPAHNMERLVARAVESAWNQTIKPDEVIVAGDGCTDKTIEVARAAGAEALDLPKGNGNVARNAGWRKSTGDVIFFLDADDWFKPTKIEAHLAQHAKGNFSVVLDPCMCITVEGVETRLCGPALNGPIDVHKFTSRSHWYGGSSFSVRRPVMEAVNGWREELSRQQDVDMWLRLTGLQGNGFVLGESHSYYLLTPNSLSRAPKNVIPNLKVLLDGLPFLSHQDKRRLWSHVMFTTADNVPVKDAIPYLLTAADRFYDPRFAKALIRSLLRGLKGKR
jgi:glycosyltransferase involved in cell wall biosynthesis